MIGYRVRNLAIVMTVCVAMMAGGCSTPNTLNLVSDDQIETMADAAWQDALSKAVIPAETIYQTRVDRVSGQLLKASGYDSEAWDIRVLDLPNKQTFSLPGNRMAIHPDLIDTAQTDGQLAFILGVQIASIKSGAAEKRINLAMLDRLSADLNLTKPGTRLNSTELRMQQFLEDERQSLRYMHEANYDTNEAMAYLQDLKGRSNASMLSQVETRIENVRFYQEERK